jgi:GAF domain-containing protein
MVYTLDESILALEQPVEFSTDDSPLRSVWMDQSPLVLEDLDRETRFFSALQRFRSKGLRSIAMLPMTTMGQRLGVLVFGSSNPSDFENGALQFLEPIAGLVGLAISNMLARRAVAGEEEQLRALTAVSIQLSERSVQAHRTLQEERTRLEAVLEINAALAATKLDMRQMFPTISKSLARTVSHDTAVVNLWNEEQRSYVVFAKGSSNGSEFAPQGMVLPSDHAFTSRILETYPLGTIVRRAELEAAAPQFDVVRNSLNAGILCWCIVPMRTSQLIGVLYLGSQSDDAFTDKDLELVRQVASGLALFVENAFTHEALQREKEGLQKLLDISRSFTPSLDAKKLFVEIANCTRSVFKQDYACLAFHDKVANVMRFSPLDSSNAPGFIDKETAIPVAECISGICMPHDKTLVLGSRELGQIESDFANRILAAGVRTLCCFPPGKPQKFDWCSLHCQQEGECVSGKRDRADDPGGAAGGRRFGEFQRLRGDRVAERQARQGKVLSRAENSRRARL